MCLVISLLFSALSYSFFMDGDLINGFINLIIAIFFIFLLARNIIKTKKERAKLPPQIKKDQN
jgi:large-conductance mechanosensitive channel